MVLVVPSPKSHSQLTGSPVDVSVKVTTSGGDPVEGTAVKEATGGGGGVPQGVKGRSGSFKVMGMTLEGGRMLEGMVHPCQCPTALYEIPTVAAADPALMP